MAYEARQTQEPTANFFAEVTAIWQKAFPTVKVTRAVMQALKPVLVAAWRRGYSARRAATLACECDGTQIFPSPAFAAEAEVPKKAVRPPKGAQRGDVFGADELRPPAKVERLLLEIEVQRNAIDKAKSPEKRRELEAVLVTLQERLDTEWPEAHRHAPPPPPRPRKPRKAAAPKSARKPRPAAAPPARWQLADHVLSWVDQEKRYHDANLDLMQVVLLNGKRSVAAEHWTGQAARIEHYEADQAHAQHLAEELRKTHPQVKVDLVARPRKGAPAPKKEKEKVDAKQKPAASAAPSPAPTGKTKKPRTQPTAPAALSPEEKNQAMMNAFKGLVDEIAAKVRG